MLERHGSGWGQSVPLTFLLPGEREALAAQAAAEPSQLWILKPCNSKGGAGIRVLSDTAATAGSGEEAVVQQYIASPYLISTSGK